MAYGSWSDYQYKNVWKNSYYAIDVRWQYATDPVNNKWKYRTTAIRVRSLNSSYSFSSSAAKVGAAGVTSTRTTKTVSASVSGGESKTFDVTDDVREHSYDSDGTLPSSTNYNVHGYFDAGLSGSYSTPTGGWNYAAINSTIPKIDRTSGTASITNAKNTTTTSTTITVKSTKPTTYARYRLNGGWWVNKTPPSALSGSSGGSGDITITDLSPNTTYKIEWQYRRDYNQVWSNTASLSVTTSKPAAPTGGAVTVSNVTHNSASVSWSGFGFTSLSSLGKYQYSLDGSSWTDNGTSTSVTITDLTPETDYTVYVRAIDNYGTASAAVTQTFTTLIDQAKVKLNVGGAWKDGKMWINVNGTWKKVKKLYVNANGTWKRTGTN